MAKSLIWAAVLIVSAVLFLGCSDDPSSNSATPPSIAPLPVADVDGTWLARGSVTGGTQDPVGRGTQDPVGRKFKLVLTMVQVGSVVTGTVMDAGGFESDMTGTVDGQTLTFTLSQGKPCAGSFTGAGTASDGDTVLTGSYSGTDCNGTFSADFTAAKKESNKP
jgi:hypothetical protein